ncbi:ribosome biogenesis GTPase Der [Desulfofundulus thermosubterraneus]|uniref:GTPase Der n=1 Tax=Desulfofundulus thermosubterraneus DSM 16057 TaxID=1121432 RepID=A0A1M6HI65_9FIRM|nr:ribosome biogenesis GTPase Der [Desulfofundulus thermosubterraneus]SHJ21883.1 GTP-binding protein [Desulfofundulus thermosubterraneus DSM 16057]
MPKPIVAIVGRPNVGKSTLFNRLVGSRIAIVEDEPGITRDRLYQDAEWAGRVFTLVDTGGLDFIEAGDIPNQVRRQVELAIEEADVVLFLVDARAGLTSTDEDVAALLRRTKKPVLLVANKVENFQRTGQLVDFFRLGLGEPIPISAAQGMNTGDLLDRLVSVLPPEAAEEEEPDTVRIAVIGRPNVGKSSLVNAILGEQRVIVSEIPGTTRDAIDTYFEREGRRYLLVDTAGIRRKSRIEEAIEKYSVIRSLRAVDRCEVALVVLDALEGVTDQDKRIAGYAHEQGKASVLAVNKWDLVEKDTHTSQRFTELIRRELAFMTYAPVVFISALTGKRVPRLLEMVDLVAQQQCLRISTSDLNRLIRDAVLHNPPPAGKNRRLKILYATQGGVKPPTFIMFVNDPELMHFSYLRYLENQLRAAFGFEGTPIRFVLRQRD